MRGRGLCCDLGVSVWVREEWRRGLIVICMCLFVIKVVWGGVVIGYYEEIRLVHDREWKLED